MSLRDRLLARFGGHRQTWRMRSRVRLARFRISRRAFAVGYAIEETSARFRALPYLLRNALLPVAFALGLVVALDLLNPTFVRLARDLGWPSVSSDTYDVLVEAVAGVTGVFLALYFSSVSTVAASVYVNVPHDIRALIVRDRLGNVYVIGVAFTMALAVLLLIAHAMTGRAYELGPPLIGVFAAFSIFAFIRLGQRAFYLADPTLLAGTLASEFVGWLKRATFKGRRWDDAAFQNYYRQRAQQCAASLASLLEIAGDQPHLRGGSVRQLTAQITTLLARYLAARDRIPTKSGWFGERYEHKQWYLTDSTELDAATATSTGLSPNTVPDVSWVENALLAPLADLVDDDLRQQDYEDVYVVLSRLEAVWTQIGQRWDAASATRWTDAFTERLITHLSSAADPRLASRPELVPAMWDALAMLPMSAELGFHRYVDARPTSTLTGELESRDWSKLESSYEIDLPRDVIGVLERMTAARAFEDAVAAPSSTRTPNWYVRELAVHAYENGLYEQANALVDLVSRWYPTTAAKLAKADAPDAMGAVLSRGIEAVWKLQLHVGEWEDIASSLRAEPLLVDVLRPARDWEAVRTKVTNLRAELLRQLGTSIPAHALRERDPAIPDYLGEAVHRVGEASFEALAENNAQLFAELFPSYFIGVFAIVSRIQTQVVKWQPQIASTAISEPVIDVMDLSGYALIFSELYDNPKLWETCQSSWHRYLDDADAPDRLKIMAVMHGFHRNLFALTHRMTGRSQRQMRANALFDDLPRSASPRPWGPGEIEHPSALIRRIAPADGLMVTPFEASDIFVTAFLAKLPGGGGLDFGVADWVGEEISEALAPQPSNEAGIETTENDDEPRSEGPDG